MKRSVRDTSWALLACLTLVACSNGAKEDSVVAVPATQGKPSTAAPSPSIEGMPPATEAPGASTPPAEARPVAVATLKELMASTVGPAADGIWNAVAVKSTKKGAEQLQPRTPEEWAAVRRYAVTLVEAMNLVVLPGRRAAPPGTKPGPGELEPAEIETGIAQKRALFVAFSKALQGTAQQALEAIDRKDIEGIVKIGGDIHSSCEACHVTFWYPNQ